MSVLFAAPPSSTNDVPPGVIQAMWHLLLPSCSDSWDGEGEAQLSPEVQLAQVRKLFGDDSACPTNADSISSFLETASAQRRLQAIAASWDEFEVAGRPFWQNPYECRPGFLDGYLVYYFSRYVPQLQFALQDILRTRRIPTAFYVLDLGVGPGTTAIAVLELLRLLDHAYRICGEPLPVEDVQFCGLDRSPKAHSYAATLVDHYAHALEQLSASHGIRNWASRGLSQIHHDLDDPRTPSLPFEPNLIVLSNTLSQVAPQHNWDAFAGADHFLRRLQPGGHAVVIEQGKNLADLFAWKDATLKRMNGLAFDDPSTWAVLNRGNLTCPDQYGERRVQSFEPHALFSRFLENSVRLAPKAWHYAAPDNDTLWWRQVILHRLC